MNKKKRVIRLLTIIYVIFCKWGDWAIINEVSCNGCSTNVYINYVAMSTVVRKFYKKSKISIYTVAFDVNYNYRFKFYF